MLGFGKKKNKEAEEAPKEGPQVADQVKDQPGVQQDAKADDVLTSDKKSPPPEKNRSIVKLILIILLFVAAVAGSAAVVWFFYFSPKSGSNATPVYEKIALEHASLSDEMLEFSFNYMPDLYSQILVYNREISLIDNEIERIDKIAQTYPDQKKIAEKEKKIWVKSRAGLEKSFMKIEKPVKEIFVLFLVNHKEGMVQVEARYPELVEAASQAIVPAQELTEKLKSKENIPQGFIKGNIYKLKKKFL